MYTRDQYVTRLSYDLYDLSKTMSILSEIVVTTSLLNQARVQFSTFTLGRVYTISQMKTGLSRQTLFRSYKGECAHAKLNIKLNYP